MLVLTVVVFPKATGGPTRGTVVANTGILHWAGSASTTDRTVTSAPANITIVEPNVLTTKTANPAATVLPGQTVTYTVTATNTNAANVSTAFDAQIVDVVPTTLTPLKFGTTTAAITGDAVSANGAVWDNTARTITFAVGTLLPAAASSFVYQAVLDASVVASGTIVNTATTTSTSLSGVSGDERTYTHAVTRTLTAPLAGLTKTRNAADANRNPGEKVRYTLVVTIPANTYAYDFTVRDVLPADIRFDAVSSVVCAPACSIGATVVGTPTAAGATVPFYLGDIASVATARTVTIAYTGIVTTSANNAARSKAELNSAAVRFNRTDKLLDSAVTTAQATGTFDFQPAAVTATITAVGPRLTLDKNVVGGGTADARRAKPGEVLSYSIIVTNAGTAPAYDTVVTDTPDSRLLNYTATLPAGVTATDATIADGTLSWTIAGPIAVNASVTIAYTVTVPANWTEAQEVAGAEIVNVADATYAGVPEAIRTANPSIAYMAYDDVTSDSVDVEVDLASIGDRLWFDTDGDGVQDAGEPGLAGVDVTVRFAGANGTFGDADDEVATTTTDADGAYLVRNLPAGQYRVTVDTADLPLGLTPSYDADGTASASQWQGTLAEATAIRTVDFGYTGTGSIGDRVWFDQDRDGVQDAGEPGLAARTVTVVWAGFDGSLATASDNITTVVTTDATGAYLVPRLAAGSYSVTVSGLPTGFTPVKDPDATADGTATTTLTAGQNRTDQDFGYAGSGSIGDTVWIDRDSDGTFDLGGATPEQGVSGATVQLDWYGIGGSSGDPVVATFTASTDTNGVYGFANLLPGSYLVRVTGGLPASSANTHDRDGNTNSQTPVTLADGQAVVDADFGYDSKAGLGQLVWWDVDGDGTQDAGEPGIAQVAISARYLGPDGVAGNADDRLFSATTGANGAWTIPDLPLGSYVVTVDAASLPVGFAPTFDFDGVATANTSAVTITGATLTQNFGYRGALALGDLVFLDRDADGTHDAGEPGLSGVGVELTWGGRNGTVGDADDLTLSTVTDATGGYTFVGLPAGAYDVHVLTATLVDPSLAAVSDLQGSDTDARAAITLSATRTDVDFGFRGTASIGSSIWHDRDADGTRDADEAGIAGVTVTATWAGRDGTIGTADDLVVATITDADGAYLFDHLPDGDWRVVVDLTTLPSGFVAATFEEDGTLDGIDAVTLNGAAHDTADFGFRGIGSLGDRVWIDIDGDGVQDAGEPGVRGQQLQIEWAGRDGLFDGVGDESWTVTTSADGAWSITGLPDGVFRVTVVGGIAAAAAQTGDPDGTLDDTSDITLTPAARDSVLADFGYLGTNRIGDTVWWDEDLDGIFGATELGLAGVTVEAKWFGLDGLPDTADDVISTAVTDAAGVWSITGLPDGDYRVSVIAGVSAGLTSVADPDTGAADGVALLSLPTATATPTVELGYDFGFAGTGSVGDRVWLDLDGDSVDDSGEPGIPAVAVELDWAGKDAVLGTADDRVYTTTTDAAGAYRFDGLPAGLFRVTVGNLPAGLTATADPDGAGNRTSRFALGAAAVDLAQDFGFTANASIGDRVFIDLDGDGVAGALEPGIAGVMLTVRLAGADGTLGTADDVLVTTVTDAAGDWAVAGLPAGTVGVSYDPTTLAGGYLPSSDRDGGSAFDTTLTLLAADALTDVDFGVVGDATLAGDVYDDRNGNGQRDAGEKGVPNVDLLVDWAGPAGHSLLLVTTDANGDWSLGALPPGHYTTTIESKTVPAGYRVTTRSQQVDQLAIAGAGLVVMGISSKSLALTGTEFRIPLFIALGLLLSGLVLAIRARRRIRMA